MSFQPNPVIARQKSRPMSRRPLTVATFSALALSISLGTAAQAADWSDTSLSWRYGTKFAEPYEGNDISKNILNFSHVSGFKYGTNFFSIDALFSDSKDPSGPDGKSGAQEVYAVYRNTLDIGKIMNKDLKFGVAKGFGITSGFDFNTKTDAGYNSKKRMLVLGPTVMFQASSM